MPHGNTGLGLELGNAMKRDNSKTWAVVINGARCRILRGIPSHSKDALAELVLRSESRKLREIMSDKPGRTFASQGMRRSAIEYASDPIAEDQQEFIRQIIALLESHRRAGEIRKLAVFAEHDMLGRLHKLMPQTLSDLVIYEVPKNLLHLSPQELSETVLAELQDGSNPT
jgi:protein required for attachment to host cells